ncbi:MAG: DNA repair protein RadC [Firmicutes bacterium]|nr:DNA repair protein RadC [Bacillota bacterium]
MSETVSSHEHHGHRERMRDRYLQSGLQGFSPHEVLEILLFFGIPRRDVNTLAHRVLAHFGSLSAVLGASPEQLKQVPGIGVHAATLLSLFIPVMRYIEHEQLGDRPLVTSYREAKEYCRHLFSGLREEVFYIVCMDARGRVLRAVPAVYGTIDEITIYPRTIVEVAIRHNAHSVLLAHNHPSGAKEPSESDIATTALLRDSLGAVDIAVRDHIIYADGECVSMAQWQQVQRVAPLLTPAAPKAADKNHGWRRGARALREAEDEELHALCAGLENDINGDGLG